MIEPWKSSNVNTERKEGGKISSGPEPSEAISRTSTYKIGEKKERTEKYI